MHIGILSRNPNLYSTRRLIAAARERGHQARIIDTTSVAVHIGDNDLPRAEPQILIDGVPGLATPVNLPPLDAVIPRIGASVTFYGLAVVRQYEAAGVPTTASSDAIARSRDKLHSLQLLAQAGLPIPRTAVVARPEALFAAVEAVGGLPAVVKLIHGTQGRGVILAHQLAMVSALLQQVKELNRQAIVQEFIAESGGCDLRLIIVGNRCVAAMQRRAPDGEFRANLHRGGTAVSIAPDAKTIALATTAARVHGLAVAGVDLIQSRRGPLILEINSSPGLEGIESVTGVDVAGAIIEHIGQAVRRARRK